MDKLLHRHRYPSIVMQQAVWLYFRFALSYRDVEDMLAERGIDVATMVRQVIRDSVGFNGLLMSDDVLMGALSGSIAKRVRASFAAGCDVVLHCNASMEEMQAVAAEAPRLGADAESRANAALRARATPREFDLIEARQAFAALLGADRPADARMAS
jgi:hypothetical protein